jgi:hypothetical protein
MAAGLGFKDFTTGEVLTAADVDGYLMQGIWVFADATARDAAVTSPQEGNFAFLKDTNVTTYYTGSAWANVDTTGMTNPMTTTGDTIYSSSGSTPARLGIGTAGQVLQVNSGATAPEWATPGGSGANWSLLNAGGTALTGAATITVSGISGKDKIMVIFTGASSASADSYMAIYFNSDTANNYNSVGNEIVEFSSSSRINRLNEPYFLICRLGNTASATAEAYLQISGCNASGVKIVNGVGGSTNSGNRSFSLGGWYNSASTISSISVNSGTGNFDAGTIYVYTSA